MSIYFPCTVAVASFESAVTSMISLTNASWWLYGGSGWDSDANLSVTGADCGLGKVCLTSTKLTLNIPEIGTSFSQGERGGPGSSGDVRPVMPVVITFNLHVYRGQGSLANNYDSDDFSVSVDADDFVIVGFCINGGKWYSLSDSPTKVCWPK